MTELTVKRWRRYGKDRLYVNTAQGARVGWIDLVSGETVVEDEALREDFTRAIQAHRPGSHDTPDPPAPATPTPDIDDPHPAAPPAGPEASTGDDHAHDPYAVQIPWTDLARNQPGQAAREQALRKGQAAPVKALAARLLGVHTDERAWRIGADGERKVADRLARLPQAWTVLHALPVGARGADIDHLVIGPGGVFTINTKHHPDARIWVGGDTFLVNGNRYPYVRNARHEAQRASRLLAKATGAPVPVRGVIAVVGAHNGLTVKAQPDDVAVIARKQIHKWLTRLPPTLPHDRIANITQAARRSDTWK